MNRAVNLKLVDTFDDTVWCRGSFLGHLILGMWMAGNTNARHLCRIVGRAWTGELLHMTRAYGSQQLPWH
jgi:hypothetical protein